MANVDNLVHLLGVGAAEVSADVLAAEGLVELLGVDGDDGLAEGVLHAGASVTLVVKVGTPASIPLSGDCGLGVGRCGEDAQKRGDENDERE